MVTWIITATFMLLRRWRVASTNRATCAVSLFFDPAEYQRHFEAAQFIVGHAGMGTIIQSLLHGKPILIMPHQAALGEQRNDHQLATAQHFLQRAGILVAQDEHEVPQRMDELLSLQTSQAIGKYAIAELLEYVRKFVNGG